MKAARLIYKGVGSPNNMGFSLVGGHSHCQFPSAQQTDLSTYINHFLLAPAPSLALSRRAPRPST